MQTPTTQHPAPATPDPLLSPSVRATLLRGYRLLDIPSNPYLTTPPAYALTDAQRAELAALEAARAALARRVVGVDYEAVPMIPLADWMVGR